jgi:flagellar motility protein MotE (MotC chaperone)
MDQLKDKPDNRENPQLQEDQTADSLNLRNRPFPVVGMGGSAGSFSAIVEFFEEVPEDSGIAFVLVQHLDPYRPSILAEILQHKCPIPVLRVEDGMEVQPNHLYVIPENKENEESNTAKEEMQALNEELMTVNVQAKAKTEELTELNNDINNLLNSSEIATLFLSNNLHVKSFTPFVTQIIPLVQSDIGRPITNLNFNLKYEHLVEDLKEVLHQLSPKEI